MAKRSDPNPKYWDDYGPFQQVKHDLIHCYLNGWYPKLGYWAGRVLYGDTHAGRGRHETGDPGSPLVALRALLDHASRDALLAKSEFNFLFIDWDPENATVLEGELSTLNPLPQKINVETSVGDAFEKLSEILKQLRSSGANMAPAFLLVDPYGFKVPAALLADLMAAGRVELFVNVMWRELDMLIKKHGPGGAQTLDEIFGSRDWESEITAGSMDERIDQAIEVWRKRLNAKWATPVVRMVTGGTATRYVLVHFTNSDDGRDLIKTCRWSLFPDGQFRVRKSQARGQQVLFGSESALPEVREWVIAKLRKKPMRWQALHAAVRSEDWLEKHVNNVVRRLKAEGKITHDPLPPKRKFGAAANPLLRLTE